MMTLLSFIVTITIVVFVHEYGHYIVARYFGVGILRFSVGFGKPLYSWTDSKKTQWVLAPIPLGGYVRMVSQEDGDQFAELGHALESVPIWQRSCILFAGPLANFILAALIYFAIGMRDYQGLRPTIGAVVPVAQIEADLLAGDEVRSINGNALHTWNDFYAGMLSILAHHADGDGRLLAPVTLTLGITRDEREQDALFMMESGEMNHLRLNFSKQLGLYPDDGIARIDDVLPDSPASRAGLTPGDVIVGINDRLISFWSEAVAEIRDHPDEPITMALWRDEELHQVAVTPAAVDYQFGQINFGQIGRLGVTHTIDEAARDALFVTVEPAFFDALARSVGQVFNTIILIFRSVVMIITGAASTDQLAGPIGIAEMSAEASEGGFYSFMLFVAFLSVTLGAANLLPIPMLDGGRLAQYAVEAVMRRPLDKRIQTIVDGCGIMAILFLMGIAIVNDLTNIIN